MRSQCVCVVEVGIVAEEGDREGDEEKKGGGASGRGFI